MCLSGAGREPVYMYAGWVPARRVQVCQDAARAGHNLKSGTLKEKLELAHIGAYLD